MLRGGYAGAVRLDRIQLATGYFAFVALVAGLLATFASGPNSSHMLVLAIVVVACTLTIFVGRVLHGKHVGQRDTFGLICTGAAAIVSLYPIVEIFSATGIGAPTITTRQLLFPDSFSFLAVLSLFVANGLYQLVDVGQWQRLLSLNPFSDGVDRSRHTVSACLNNIAISSPLTWVIAIVFGASLKLVSTEADAYQATHLLVDYILSLPGISKNVLLALLLVAMIAIMFSTIDALISATGFTITNDIFGERSRASKGLTFDRLITLGTLVVQLFFYLIVKELAADKTDAVLYLCWSFQIAFAPAVVATLYSKALGQGPLVISILAGVVGACLPLVAFGPDSVYEFSPWYALLFASAGLASSFLNKIT